MMVRTTGQESDSLGESSVTMTFYIRPTRWSFLGGPKYLHFTQLLQESQAQKEVSAMDPDGT